MKEAKLNEWSLIKLKMEKIKHSNRKFMTRCPMYTSLKYQEFDTLEDINPKKSLQLMKDNQESYSN